MKKYALAPLALVLALNTAQATMTATSHHLFYCPEKISCKENGNPDSCTLSGSYADYWSFDKTYSPQGTIVKGDYTFARAEGEYEADPDNGECFYEINSGRVHKEIRLWNAHYAYTRPAFEDSIQWYINGYHANCSSPSLNPKDCPFYEPGLLISNRPLLHIKLSSNGLAFKESNNKSIIAYQSQALAACAGDKQCKLDVHYDPDYTSYAGSVTVDMSSDDLRILRVDPAPDSDWVMKQYQTFNTVVFEKAKRGS